MLQTWIRSTIFNLVFYIFTALYCVISLPCLILPYRMFIAYIGLYFKCLTLFEKYIIGLNIEIRGREHIPQGQAYIIAAKHYSTYETMKIPALFNDFSIIMKRELMWIPLWGWLAAKAQMIPINRNNRDQAIESIISGAKRMKDLKRPIIIFPQGTRVSIHHSAKDKHYRQGVAHMAVGANLPVIPLAMNSGVFWPRHSWLKYPGTVVFEFGPAITHDNGDKKALVKQVENFIETHSTALVNEALSAMPAKLRQHIEHKGKKPATPLTKPSSHG